MRGRERGIKVSYGIDYAKQHENGLLLELDYELASLHEAITNGDDDYKAKCIENLKEIRHELEIMRTYGKTALNLTSTKNYGII